MKIKVSRKEIANAILPFTKDNIPDTLILEGEAVEQEKPCCSLKHQEESRPELPELLDWSEPYKEYSHTWEVGECINQLIRYLKARE